MFRVLSVIGADETNSSFFEHQHNIKATLNARLIDSPLDTFLRLIQSTL